MPDTIDLTDPKPLTDASSEPWTDGVETNPDTLAAYLSLPDACPGVARRPDSDATLLTSLAVAERVKGAVAAVPTKGRQRPEAPTVLDVVDVGTPATILDLQGVLGDGGKSDLTGTAPTVQMQGVPPAPAFLPHHAILSPRVIRTPTVSRYKVPIFVIILEYCLPLPLRIAIKRMLRKFRLLD